MFSILIPTFNNIEYLKICLNSIRKNSKFSHQIILHINDGSDGTRSYANSEGINYTYSENNIGMPKALNKASKHASNKYILISHDDFYYCPKWDVYMASELNKIDTKKFYISGTMLESNNSEFNFGTSYENFNEIDLLENLNKIKKFDFQGSTKCPGLIHRDLWDEVGGWSEEFSPTGGDDSDFAMKLWNANVRIFKGLGSSRVYHFGSITTRKKDKKLNTYLGSKGNKIFLKKWGISISFFEKRYLRTKQIYNGILTEPKKSLFYYIDLIFTKINLYYLKFFFKF